VVKSIFIFQVKKFLLLDFFKQLLHGYKKTFMSIANEWAANDVQKKKTQQSSFGDASVHKFEKNAPAQLKIAVALCLEKLPRLPKL